MNAKKPLIVDVVENDLCIACGACVHACPESAVEPVYHEGRAAHEIRVTSYDRCLPCPAPCEDVCPSIEVDFTSLLNNANIERMGPVEKIYVGHSPRHRDNGISSSGGVIRAFVEHSLGTGHPVICLGEEGGSFQPIRLDSPEDLSKVPGSIYHSVSFVRCLDLLKALASPCLLIATPCQLEGIFKYIREIEPELSQKIGLVIGLICGWMYSDHAIRSFAAFKGIQERIRSVRYRGEDQVGLLKIKTDSGVRSFHRRVFRNFQDATDYRASFSTPMSRLRCRVCEDHLNVLADVAVGDAWLARTRPQKLSIVVTRTIRGEKILQALVAAKEVLLEASSPVDLIESQSSDLVDGRKAMRLNALLKEDGRLTPQFRYSKEAPEQPPVTEKSRNAYKTEKELRALARSGDYAAFRQRHTLIHRVKLFKAVIKSRAYMMMKRLKLVS